MSLTERLITLCIVASLGLCILKLAGLISLSWWLITIPLWWVLIGTVYVLGLRVVAWILSW